MEHSRAYQFFIKQYKAEGYEKKDGYYHRIMEEIYDWERDEVEDKIWDKFCREEDLGLAQFLPKLKKYPGIKRLEEALGKRKAPGYVSFRFALTLYVATADVSYFEIVKENIELEPNESNKYEFVSTLTDCKPDPNIYNFLVQTYINSADGFMRFVTLDGILYNKGIIEDPDYLSSQDERVEYYRKFDSEDISERKEIIEKLERNELF